MIESESVLSVAVVFVLVGLISGVGLTLVALGVLR